MSGDVPLQKFRPRGAQRLADILKPDVLDDETRQHLVRAVQAGVAAGSTERDIGHQQERQQGSGTHSSEVSFPAIFRERVSNASGDVVNAMVKRLKTLEAQQQAYRSELKEKNEKIDLLQSQRDAEKARREEAETLVVDLFNDKEELERQIADMKEFLADYGLHWVGSGETPQKGTDAGDFENNTSGSGGKCIRNTNTRKSIPHVTGGEDGTVGRFDLYSGDFINETPREPSECSVQGTKASDTEGETIKKGDIPIPVSIELLKRNARILSDHVGFREVTSEGKRGTIKEREVVKIAVYRDGICVNSGPFRPFGWPLCDAVLNDIVDGYYPYEFKQRYPEGFPIDIADLSHMCHDAVDAESDGSNKGVKSIENLAGGGYQTVTREEFIKRLPATRIAASGRVVDIQGGIAKLIGVDIKGGRSDENPNGETAVLHVSNAEREKTSKISGKGDFECVTSARDLTPGCQETPGSCEKGIHPRRIEGMVALLLRFPCGKRVIMHLLPGSTVGELRREISLAVPTLTVEYNICLPFPATVLCDDSATLADVGIRTACTLMIQPLVKK
uniref:UBX domain-containing protein 11 n=1 Tax=Trypanosoma congolense (strain IL3000) TaxID=1068625 RepID=G0UXC1_TRYCI|nr:conserved hypothetical protein [Trypanosoma congolense IL3000]